MNLCNPNDYFSSFVSHFDNSFGSMTTRLIFMIETLKKFYFLIYHKTKTHQNKNLADDSWNLESYSQSDNNDE